MDVNKVNEIVTWLAKNGDKETMKYLSTLIFEISKFESKSSIVKENRKVETKQSLSEHAASILDGESVNLYTPKLPTYERNINVEKTNPYDSLGTYTQPKESSPFEPQYQGGSRMMANNVGITNHAADLL